MSPHLGNEDSDSDTPGLKALLPTQTEPSLQLTVLPQPYPWNGDLTTPTSELF